MNIACKEYDDLRRRAERLREIHNRKQDEEHDARVDAQQAAVEAERARTELPDKQTRLTEIFD